MSDSAQHGRAPEVNVELLVREADAACKGELTFQAPGWGSYGIFCWKLIRIVWDRFGIERDFRDIKKGFDRNSRNSIGLL